MAMLAVIGQLAGGAAQTLAPKPAAYQRATAVTGPTGAQVSAGATLSLWVVVAPRVNVHVYGPGAKDVAPVSLVLTPQAGVTAGKVVYPAAELAPTVGLPGLVPVYKKMFRVTQPVTVASTVARGTTLTIAGAVNYQACDDRICYPADALPVIWTVLVK